MTVIHDHLDATVLEELRLVLAEDFSALVQTFLVDSDQRLAMLHRGLAGADSTAVREAAHSLKGSCLNIGAHRLAALCLDVETRARDGDLHGLAGLLDAMTSELRNVSVFLRKDGY